MFCDLFFTSRCRSSYPRLSSPRRAAALPASAVRLLGPVVDFACAAGAAMIPRRPSPSCLRRGPSRPASCSLPSPPSGAWYCAICLAITMHVLCPSLKSEDAAQPTATQAQVFQGAHAEMEPGLRDAELSSRPTPVRGTAVELLRKASGTRAAHISCRATRARRSRTWCARCSTAGPTSELATPHLNNM